MNYKANCWHKLVIISLWAESTLIKVSLSLVLNRMDWMNPKNLGWGKEWTLHCQDEICRNFNCSLTCFVCFLVFWFCRSFWKRLNFLISTKRSVENYRYLLTLCVYNDHDLWWTKEMKQYPNNWDETKYLFSKK